MSGFLLTLLFISAGIIVLIGAGNCIKRAGKLLFNIPLPGGANWVFSAGAASGYLLLLWRMWEPSKEGIGIFWAVALWISAGLLASQMTSVGILIGMEELQRASGREIDGVYTLYDHDRLHIGRILRILIASIAAGVAAFVILEQQRVHQLTESMYAIGISLVSLVLFGPLTQALPKRREIALLHRLTRDNSDWRREQSRLETLTFRAMKEWRTATRQVVSQSVLRHVHEAVRPPFATVMNVLDRSGLGQMRAGQRAVHLEAFDRLRRLIDGITGGAVGVAGPRGAGKSTLLEAYLAGKFLEPGKEHIAVFESAPVRYDAREFTLHLYDRSCSEVVKFCKRHLQDKQRRVWLSLKQLRELLSALVIVAAWLTVGFVGASGIGGEPINILQWLNALWWPLVIVLAAATTLYTTMRRRSARNREPIRGVQAEASLELLRTYARECQEAIHFQQKHTSGWSGKVSLLFGSEAGRSGAQELTKQPLSYPQLVHDFREFLTTTINCLRANVPTAGVPCVVVILDELDKILAPGEAQDFVNEIKALFNLEVPGFLFLMSVSEDALAAFERRGLPFRDAFDSAFDVIFRVEYLKLDDARAVLASRILRMPEPFICFCHCVAGGLPRELIRAARQVTARKGSLPRVCIAIVTDDLRSKIAGLRTVIARQAHDDALAANLMRHVEAHVGPDEGVLLAAAANPPIQPSQRGETNPDEAYLIRLQLETLGYFYYCGTLVEVFSEQFSEEDLVKGRDSVGDASFDTLASVRQLFSVNARLAWLTVSAFRKAWGKSILDLPA